MKEVAESGQVFLSNLKKDLKMIREEISLLLDHHDRAKRSIKVGDGRHQVLSCSSGPSSATAADTPRLFYDAADSRFFPLGETSETDVKSGKLRLRLTCRRNQGQTNLVHHLHHWKRDRVVRAAECRTADTCEPRRGEQAQVGLHKIRNVEVCRVALK